MNFRWFATGFFIINLLYGTPLVSFAAEDSAGEADKAWKAVEKATRPPTPPEEWRTNRPSADTIAKFREQQGKLAGEAADKARDFYTRFSNHPKAGDARKKEYEMASIAVQLGNTNLQAR